MTDNQGLPNYSGDPQGGGGFNNPGPPPNNNLVWAILTTILCCLPFGIVSIVKSTQVNTLWAQGQPAAAQEAADAAKKWAIISAIVAAVLWVLYILLFVVLGVFAASVDVNNYR
ncbi:CD225/dispanin family protein [Amycolatopsis orientalis]|uniref:CD225/dispanin family protein n=1 Tax=Amycolatopsis orientalis TaxID=31958 RepID=UPI0004191D7D|nr:CD225/dispanin family protein [Amycolatopsis orientalis]